MVVGDVLQCGASGGASLWIVDVGDEPPHGPVPGILQNRGGRRITGIHPQRFLGGSWEYPPLDEAMQETGLEEVEAYVFRRNNMVKQYNLT